MIRPIRLTEALKEACRAALEGAMTNARLAEGKFCFERTFHWEDEIPKVIVRFSMKAYLKMLKLVSEYSSEVGWNGIVYRDEEQENLFHITDIVVCPQTVTGVTVDTDQSRLEEWMRALPIEVFNHMRLQGHSHVNMSVSPSGVDTKNWREIISNLVDDGRDEYYIFMIWNKKLEHTVRVYDYTNNRFYDDASTSVEIDEAGFDLDAFMRDVKESVKSASQYSQKGGQSSYGSGGYGSGGYGSGGYKKSYCGNYGGGYDGYGGYDDDVWEDTPSGRGVKVTPSSNPQKPRPQEKVVELPAKTAETTAGGGKNDGGKAYAATAFRCASCASYYECKAIGRTGNGEDCKDFKFWREE